MDYSQILKGGVGSGKHPMSGGNYCSFHKDTNVIAFKGNKPKAMAHVKANPNHKLGYTSSTKLVGDKFGV